MVRKLSTIAIPVALLAGALLGAGCGQPEEPVVENPGVKAQAQESASVWTEEQKQAMQKALANRREERTAEGK